MIDKKNIRSFIEDVCWFWNIETDSDLKEIEELEIKHFGFSTIKDVKEK